MNFKQISEQYPKAWEKLKFFAGYNIFVKEEKLLYWVEEYKEPYPIRNLYDFFDAQRIWTFVYPYEFNTEPDTDRFITLFRYTIMTKVNGEIVNHDSTKIDPEKRGYQTRPETEEAGWLKAFEILESKL